MKGDSQISLLFQPTYGGQLDQEAFVIARLRIHGQGASVFLHHRDLQ
jgi:hypothetical protein